MVQWYSRYGSVVVVVHPVQYLRYGSVVQFGGGGTPSTVSSVWFSGTVGTVRWWWYTQYSIFDMVQWYSRYGSVVVVVVVVHPVQYLRYSSVVQSVRFGGGGTPSTVSSIWFSGTVGTVRWWWYTQYSIFSMVQWYSRYGSVVVVVHPVQYLRYGSVVQSVRFGGGGTPSTVSSVWFSGTVGTVQWWWWYTQYSIFGMVQWYSRSICDRFC
ncbi:UNVERIFIED_CONTAM: hypothetical protein FKN15_052410 [Acipenser sinensis]